LFCSYHRAPIISVTHRKRIGAVFCPPTDYRHIYSSSFPGTISAFLFAFPQLGERKKRTEGRADIRRNTFKLSLC